MRRITSFNLRLQTLVVGMAAVLSAFGVWQLRDAPLGVVPEFSPPSLAVKETLSLSSAGVESMITAPLEADLLNGVPWLRSTKSESMAGVSTIELAELCHGRG